MKLKTIKQEKNSFMERDELTVEIISESSPSASELIAELKKDEALTVIKKINTNFGQQKFLADVLVYDNIEAKEKIETIPQKIRKKMEADKKAAEEAAKKEAEATKKAEEEAKAAAEAEATKPEEKTEEPKDEPTKEEEKKE